MPGFNRRTIPAGANYTNDGTILISTSIASGGGWYSIDPDNGDCFAQMYYGPELSLQDWSDEQQLFSGASGTIPPLATGIRFRNVDDTTPAVVTAWLSARQVPALGVSAVGAASVSALTVTGLVAADGTIISGSGFTVAHPSTGNYTISFSPALATVPVVTGTVQSFGRVFNIVAPPTVNGFFATVENAGALDDQPFGFLATPSH